MHAYLHFLTFLLSVTVPPALAFPPLLSFLPEITFTLPPVMHSFPTAHLHRVHIVLVWPLF